MKNYLILLQDGSKAKVKSTQRPKREPHYAEIIEAPNDLEHADDADIIEEQTDFGETRKRVVVNEQKRQARLQAKALKEQQRKEAEEQEGQRRQAIKNRVQMYEAQVDNINNIAELKTLLKELVRDVAKIAERTL